MTIRDLLRVWAIIMVSVPAILAANSTEKIHNDKVRVVEQTLAPGEIVTLSTVRASVVVYLDNGTIESIPPGAKPQKAAVKPGETAFKSHAGFFRNAGTSPLRIVLTEFLGRGGSQTWGTTGLGQDYTLLFENQFGRVYSIKVTAGETEPLHSHQDRIVICISGAELEHEMADGRREAATLKTGEIVWREGVTHVGHNVGKTDLLAIAIEPK